MRIAPLLFTLLGLLTAHVSGQGDGAAPPSRAFGVGERLTYKGELSKVINGFDFGDLSFSIEPNGTSEGFTIRSEAKSRGTLLAILRFSFLQKYESVVASGSLRADRTVKYDQQKERIRESDTVFDYESGRVTFTERNPKTPLNAPRVIASAIKGDTHDVITGIYALRTLPLEVGKTFDMTVSDSGLVYTIPVKVTARELQRTIVGRVMCFRVEPEVFGKGRFIEDAGSMAIWITDTPSRIPVRSQIKTSLGKVDIKLKGYRAPDSKRADIQTSRQASR